MKIKNILISTILLIGAVSCTYQFEEINKNPNKHDRWDIKSYNCFEPIIYGVGSNAQNYNRYWNNELTQVTAYTQGNVRQQHMYQVTDGNWQSAWDTYARYGGDANHMIELAQRDGDKYYEALGLILKVYNLSNLAALFGEIPYSEAYQYDANVTPAFETAANLQDIFIRDLDSANVILSRNPVGEKYGIDGVYDDDKLKWRKFANSLKLRLLCRAANANQDSWSDIQAIISDPQTYPIFESNGDNAMVNFQTLDPYKSYWGASNETKSGFTCYRFTEQMIKMMAVLNDEGNATYNDPRLPVWASMRDGKWKGTIAGCTESQKDAADEGSSVGNFEIICRADMPAYLMDYSEILFILAEGVNNGKLTSESSAKELYEAAVRANMEKWAPLVQFGDRVKSIKSSDIDAFLESELGGFDSVGAEGSLYETTEELILSQKWLSLFSVNMEGYHEWRRTEYPILTVGDGTIYNDFELPTRFGYPNFTVSSNAVNVNKALELMGGPNDMHTPLWWSYKKLNGKNRNPHPNQN